MVLDQRRGGATPVMPDRHLYNLYVKMKYDLSCVFTARCCMHADTISVYHKQCVFLAAASIFQHRPCDSKIIEVEKKEVAYMYELPIHEEAKCRYAIAAQAVKKG